MSVSLSLTLILFHFQEPTTDALRLVLQGA